MEPPISQTYNGTYPICLDEHEDRQEAAASSEQCHNLAEGMYSLNCSPVAGCPSDDAGSGSCSVDATVCLVMEDCITGACQTTETTLVSHGGALISLMTLLEEFVMHHDKLMGLGFSLVTWCWKDLKGPCRSKLVLNGGTSRLTTSVKKTLIDAQHSTSSLTKLNDGGFDKLGWMWSDDLEAYDGHELWQ
ncbi:hypothetical protein BDQ12DRAFT_672076 [Crucibulum laeve]|uniref:Uncharacterized protein n=1 Tax=Crucibulum laeve TaxID=68775 RepID=A0A5C3LR26_9AGAR|nr:hypothetical protein BDQ12DRAFT_672076 [Crucibulum laeve]